MIATNHHVAAGYIEGVSSKERDLLKNGFLAKSQAEELKIPDASASVLVSYENVTERVQKAAGDANDAAKRSGEIANIEKDCPAGLTCQVIACKSGGEYWQYRFKIYRDVRLVIGPVERGAFFGGIFPMPDALLRFGLR